MKTKNSNLSSLLLFSLSLFLFVCIYRVIYMDMFFDGLIYASISRNMANGVGSFWYPYYTQFFLNPFYEHPPLVFWLQSFAFRLFGDHRLVEFFWGTLCALLTIFFTYRTYLLSEQKNENKQLVSKSSWFVIFLFATIPTISWTFNNNILENTMAVFTSCSIWLMLYSFISGRKVFLFNFIAGLCIACAFLSKGLTGMFPLAVPFILFFAYKKTFSKDFKQTLLKPYLAITGSILLLGVIFYVFKRQESAAYLFYYFNNQIVKSLNGQRENIRYMYLVYRFLGELIVPLFIAMFLYSILKWTKKYLKPAKQDNSFFIAMLLVAISASFPTFISPKQRIWYLFASWPFYSLAIAYYFRNTALSINKLFEIKLLRKITLIISWSLIVISLFLVLFCSGTKFKRLHAFYDDMISQNVFFTGEQVSLSTCPKSLQESWEVLAFMQRYYKASFTPKDGGQYLIMDKKYSACAIPPKNCMAGNLNPERFALYTCLEEKIK
ncbi:MAG: glycosyltransferase family 39 protein [bacterium]